MGKSMWGNQWGEITHHIDGNLQIISSTACTVYGGRISSRIIGRLFIKLNRKCLTTPGLPILAAPGSAQDTATNLKNP